MEMQRNLFIMLHDYAVTGDFFQTLEISALTVSFKLSDSACRGDSSAQLLHLFTEVKWKALALEDRAKLLSFCSSRDWAWRLGTIW